MYNVGTIRKTAFPSLKFPRGCKRKELVQQECANLYPDVDWPLKRTGKLKDENYDMADAFVVAMAGYKNLNKTKVKK